MEGLTTLRANGTPMQDAYPKLHSLKESLCERRNLSSTGASDPDLLETTDEEIEARAVSLTRRLHDEKIWKLDKEIMAFL